MWRSSSSTPPHVLQQCKLIACNAITFSNPQLPSLRDVLTTVLGLAPTAPQLHYMAWWLGMWVTVGMSSSAWIVQGGAPPSGPHHHKETADRLLDYSRLFDEPIIQALHSASSAGWPMHWFKYGVGSVADRVLRSYGLLCNKHIPHALVCDSLGVRRRLLAGIIDGAGYHDPNNVYNVQAKHRRVVDGCKELAATLGLRNAAVQLHACTNQQTGEVYRGHRVTISGHMWDVAQYCAATTLKQCPKSAADGHVEKNKDSRCYGFTVTKLPAGDYFGFAVHGGANRRFLLADYTVTHNVSSHSPHLTSQPLPGHID